LDQSFKFCFNIYTGYSEKHETVWNMCHYGM